MDTKIQNEKEQLEKKLKLKEEKFLRQMRETEKLRKIKIEIKDKKRQQVMEKKLKRDLAIEQLSYKLGYKARVKELLKYNPQNMSYSHRYSYGYLDRGYEDNRQKWIHDQMLKREREQELIEREKAEMEECVQKLHEITFKQTNAQKRYERNMIKKTYSGRDEYNKLSEKREAVLAKEKENSEKRLIDYAIKINKHEKLIKEIDKHKKWSIAKKSRKQAAKLNKVFENLEKKNKTEQNKIKQIKQKHNNDLKKIEDLEHSESSSKYILKLKDEIRFENAKTNRERLKRQQEYKNMKVMIKHAKSLTNLLRKKVDMEAKIQSSEKAHVRL